MTVIYLGWRGNKNEPLIFLFYKPLLIQRLIFTVTSSRSYDNLNNITQSIMLLFIHIYHIHLTLANVTCFKWLYFLFFIFVLDV